MWWIRLMTGKFKQFLWLTALFFWVVSLCIVIVINCVPLYLGVVEVLSIPQKLDVSLGVILSDFLAMIRYIQLPGGSLDLTHFQLSASAREHFVDVKNWVLFNEGLCLVLSVYILPKLKQLHREGRLWQLNGVLHCFQWISFPFICLLMAGFNRFFIWFHQLLFRKQNWVFNPQFDTVILILPAEYFLACFILFFILYEMIMIGIKKMGRKELKE